MWFSPTDRKDFNAPPIRSLSSSSGGLGQWWGDNGEYRRNNGAVMILASVGGVYGSSLGRFLPVLLYQHRKENNPPLRRLVLLWCHLFVSVFDLSFSSFHLFPSFPHIPLLSRCCPCLSLLHWLGIRKIPVVSCCETIHDILVLIKFQIGMMYMFGFM